MARLNPCKICDGTCMEMEGLKQDWYGRGEVVRIFSLCDDSLYYRDDVRTEFAPLEEAVEEWNDMNTPEAKKELEDWWRDHPEDKKQMDDMLKKMKEST